MKTIFLIAAIFVQAASLAAQEKAVAKNKSATKRVAFAQSCSWTGEMKLGQTDAVKADLANVTGEAKSIFKTPTWTSR